MGIITEHRMAAAVPPEAGGRAAGRVAAPRGRVLRRTASYLTAAETHTYASSIAAQAMLSFFPFIVFLLSFTRGVLRAPHLYRGLLTLVGAYLPVGDTPAEQARSYILDNLRTAVEHHHRAPLFSLLILLATCTGIFLPLEVALNRVWDAPRNRSYLRNWAVALGLAFSCGALGLLSASLTALAQGYATRLAHFLEKYAPGHLGAVHSFVPAVSLLVVRAGALPATIAVFFLIYWRLPNVRVPASRVLPAAAIIGIGWEVSKYAYIALLPALNFREIYGPFALSVSLVLWAYVSALLLLGGADIVAETRRLATEQSPTGLPARPLSRGAR